MATCEICGAKIGGILGATQADEEFYARAKAVELILPENICVPCAKEKVINAEHCYKIEKKKKDNEELKQKIDSIFISPMPVPNTMQDCGLVTGYSILGTGPLTTFASSLTDFFGEESKAYHSKIKKSENFAIMRMKLEAIKLSCSAIYNVHINIQEATSGHGMIMVSVSGAAAKDK